MGLQIVEESEYGVYLWQMPDGALVCDEEKNFLSISSKKGDEKRIAEITSVARQFGLGEGHPIFFSGHRKVTDEEYEEQKQRMEDGLIPDEYDVAAWADAERDKKHLDD